MIGRRLAAIAAGLVLGSSASAADDAGKWLVKVSHAARTANYEGVLVYRGEETLETFRVIHRYADGAERERAQSMTGEVREVLKQNDKVTCLLSKDRQLSTDARAAPKGLLRPLSEDRLQQISTVYTFTELGESRIAGRICRGVAVVPRDEFRYGYELWADRETGVPLKLSLMAPDGKLLEQMFFTEMKFPASIPDSMFDQPVPLQEARRSTATAASAIALAHELEPVASLAVAPDSAPPQLSKLPPGYRVVRREVRNSPAGAREHLVLSDGLSAISVYRVLRPAGENGADPRLDQMGPLNAYSRNIGRVYITVVGEAPGRTVKMIAENVETELADFVPAAAQPGPVAVPN